MLLDETRYMISQNKQFYWTHLSFLVSCIACFKCVSAGGDNPSCEVRKIKLKKIISEHLYMLTCHQDPFHNNMTEGEVTLEQPCMGGRKGRDGLFPASDCIKVTGYYGEWQEKGTFHLVILPIQCGGVRPRRDKCQTLYLLYWYFRIPHDFFLWRLS